MIVKGDSGSSVVLVETPIKKESEADGPDKIRRVRDTGTGERLGRGGSAHHCVAPT